MANNRFDCTHSLEDFLEKKIFLFVKYLLQIHIISAQMHTSQKSNGEKESLFSHSEIHLCPKVFTLPQKNITTIWVRKIVCPSVHTFQVNESKKTS